MLKATALVIAENLANLFNKSLMTGKCPLEWKFYRIVPIPKSGDHEYPSNYKPISILSSLSKLLSILSKLLEKHAHNLISQCLNNCTPLSQNQWVFHQVNRPQLLCFHSLVIVTNSQLRWWSMLCILFNLSKAFDKVSHQRLLNKLYSLKLDNFPMRWFSDYLINRTKSVVLGGAQSVVLGGAQSRVLPVISSVSQGSILGPLLFVVFIDGVSTAGLK